MKKCYCKRLPGVNPQKNLEFESSLLRFRRSGFLFLLWQNGRSVILGRNQKAEEEVDLLYAESRGIPVVHRQTGGGAVYHDLGNVNYSFITDYDPSSPCSMGDFAKPVVRALQGLGADAYLSGRNDILVDGKKVCGTAERIDGRRILSHGCILVSTDLHEMARVLTPPEEKLVRHGIASVRSRVANLTDWITGITPESLMDALEDSMRQDYDLLPLE